ncbi:membrane protein [Aureimonas sp. SA4125]|uniref:DsbA family protein n=1 Tax=Aureimonas sp. SA4125 TaxID=2826993 RepID=UPI001CC45DC0|nr:DsbA family protein [Aureimonas sp. SA4125]BDA84501.1 membrane protein [Aureimonas sp. SA4125]
MIRKSLLAATAAALALASPVPAMALTAGEKTDIEAVVRDYLIRNPEVLLEAMDALQAKRQVQELAEQKEAIALAGPNLFATPAGTVFGNPQGDVTIVEFFDYNCGYCKKAMTDMQALVEADPKLRFVLKEVPVLGPQSMEASQVSLAFRHVAPERYVDFHMKLLGLKGVANADSALTVAEELGVDEAAIRTAMTSPEVEETLKEDARIAELLKITGTPSYVLANEVVPGAIGMEGLAEKIANVRSCGKTAC